MGKACLALLSLLAATLLAIPPAFAAHEPKLPDGMQAYLDASKPAWASDAELVKAVADGGANWVELAKALDEAVGHSDSSRLPAIAWIIKSAPHLDRLELTARLLASNYLTAALDADEYGYSRKSDFFKRYLLNYRMDDEPVTDWREVLRLRYLSLLGKSIPGEQPSQQVDNNKWLINIAQGICSDFAVLERGFYGNLADPVSIDNSRAGTKREYALFTAATFRSMGLGTRFVRDNRSGESWVEVYWALSGVRVGGDMDFHFISSAHIADDNSGYDEQLWLPVYPTAPEHSGDFAYATELCGGRLSVVTAGDAFGREQVTARYGPTARIRPVFLKGEPSEEVKDFAHWSVSAWYKGAWVPLDDLEYPSSDKDYPLDEPAANGIEAVWYTVGAPGRYLMTAGVRYPGGVVHVQTAEFDVEPGDAFEHYFGLDAPAELPDAALIERQIAAPLPAGSLISAQGRNLFLITDDSEPSKRAETMLEPLRSLSSLNYQVHRADSTDPAVQALLVDALKYDKADPLPVLVLVVEGQARLYLRGYNLNALDWVQRELAR